ncbi:MAG TPA: hypothetical protein VLV54_09470 [Thermoanaerobaculia bacterium]|nr:hypothetical protein [Thermoanaerobaculia bacterium]
MAETQRIASALVTARPAAKPRPRHPTRQSSPLRPALDPPHDLPAKARVVAAAPSTSAVHTAAGSPQRKLPRRTPAERVILAVLLTGLGLNVVALMTSPRLSRSDLLLGATVLVAGLVLLTLMELCRRLAPPPADEPD